NDGDSSLFTKTDDSSSTESTSPPRNNNDHQYEKIKSNEPEKPDNLFLCTISNQSHIVNIKAELYQYNRTIKWSNPPDNVCILPTKDDVLVVAFEKNLIEIATLKHGEIIKREAKGVPVRFLGESMIKSVETRKCHYNINNEICGDSNRLEIDSGIRR
ncbi:7533_t:CDS:1, partial [Entrophospora sp. SA101]